MSFNNNSNFNKKANFTEVKFGENKPVLEVELNELQQIQNEARADIIRDTIPSGFTQLGEIDYDYSSAYDSALRFKTDSTAYVNGYRIYIPEGTIVNLPKAPEYGVREDFVFLEVWKQEVTNLDDISKYGGEGQPLVNNSIQDQRYPLETTRRVALKWRFRCVEGLDFNAHPNGLRKSGQPWTPYECKGLGGNKYLSDLKTYSGSEYFYTQCNHKGDLDARNGGYEPLDVGLYICGNGSEKSKKDLKTVDGYCFAIPMFKITRKPAVGKAKPFEYTKIGLDIPSDKFNKLMQLNNVETVDKISIEGETLINLSDFNINYNLSTPSSYDVVKTPTKISVTRLLEGTENWGYFWSKLKKDVLKPNSTYTIALKAETPHRSAEREFIITPRFIRGDGTRLVSQAPKRLKKVTSDGWYVGVLNTIEDETTFYEYYDGATVLYINNLPNLKETVSIYHGVMIFAGDVTETLTKTLRREPIKDIHNVGGLEARVDITNNITPPDCYAPEQGVPLLDTTGGKGRLNYNCHLPIKMTTQDVENAKKITSIKGVTYNNLLETWYDSATSIYSGVALYRKGSVKPNTKYTLFIYNTTGENKDFYVSEDTFQEVNYFTVPNGQRVKFYLTSKSSLDYNKNVIVKNNKNHSNPNNKLHVALYEGRVEEDLPFFRGMMSLGEQDNNTLDIYTHTKNLISPKDFGMVENANHEWESVYTTGGVPSKHWVKLKPNTTYTLTITKTQPNSWVGYAIYVEEYYYKYLGNNGDQNNYKVTFTTPNCGMCHFVVGGNSATGQPIQRLQLEENGSATSYIDKAVCRQKIYLGKPLRSVSPTIYDEIVGNKLIRRVKKIVFNGSENWQLDTLDRGDVARFVVNNLQTAISDSSPVVCNLFPNMFDVLGENLSRGNECIMNRCNGTGFNVHIKKSRLTDVSVTAFKTWLSNHNLEVYYELPNPIEEDLPNYSVLQSGVSVQLTEPLRNLGGVKDEIVGNTVIRRTGMYIIREDEPKLHYVDTLSNDTTALFCVEIPNIKQKKSVWSNIFAHDPSCNNASSTREGIFVSVRGSVDALYIRILKARLVTVNVNGFKKWLKDNPIEVLFCLNNIQEVKLQEVNTYNNSLHRQFTDLYTEGDLLEINPTIKDTYSGGRITRNVKKHRVTSSSNISIRTVGSSSGSGDGTTTISFTILDTQNLAQPLSPVLCSMFPEDSSSVNAIEGVGVSGSEGELYIEILRSRLETPDLAGFKKWVDQNNLEFIYQLKTPTVEIPRKFVRYVPIMRDNSYTGSLYVADGSNYIEYGSINRNPNVTIETHSRTGKAISLIKDCSPKKHVDGTDIYIATSRTLNRFTGVVERGNIDVGQGDNLDDTTMIRSGEFAYVGDCEYVTVSSPDSQSNVATRFYNSVGKLISFEVSRPIPFTSKVPQGCSLMKIVQINNNNVNTRFQIQEGKEATEYVKYSKASMYPGVVKKHEIEDFRNLVSLTGFNYEKLLKDSFRQFLKGEL